MKKLLGIVVLGLLLVGCGPTVYEGMSNEEFESQARAKGAIYFARSLPIDRITADGSKEQPAAQGASAISQEEANRYALDSCHKGGEGSCIIFMEGSNITPEAERLIKEAKLAEQKKISDKKVELLALINEAKSICKELDFKEGTEKFSDCALKLYTQKIDQTTKQKETVIVQTQASSGSMTIYDPVRDNQRMIDQGMKMLSGRCTLGIDC